MGCAQATSVVEDAHELLTAAAAAPSFHEAYLLSNKLGKGAFATVYAARRTDSGEEVAVKVGDLRRDRSTSSFRNADKDSRQERQVSHEVRMLEKVTGLPNIVGFVAAFTEGSLHYLVMEKCSRDLLSMLQAMPVLTVDTMRPYLRQMLQGIDAAHSVGVVHRDVKLENFMCVGSPPTVKLCDFGLAAPCQPGRRELQGSAGTAPYMSPEMVKGETYGCEADIWAFGVVLYTLFYGQFPFVPARLSSELMKEAIRSDAPVRFSAAEGLHQGICVSPCTEAFVRRLLSRSVAERPSSQEALADSFFSCAESGMGCLRATVESAEKLCSRRAHQAQKMAAKTDVDAQLDVRRALSAMSSKATSCGSSSPMRSISEEDLPSVVVSSAESFEVLV